MPLAFADAPRRLGGPVGDERLIAGVGHERTGIVGETTVHGHVGAQAGASPIGTSLMGPAVYRVSSVSPTMERPGSILTRSRADDR